MSPKEGPQLVCDLCRSRAEGLGWVDPAAPGANVGRRPEPERAESPTGRLERAVARFNASEAARTVAGLMRTLGQPQVSIGSAAGSPSEVRVTVAWELCWYQWGSTWATRCAPYSSSTKAARWSSSTVPPGSGTRGRGRVGSSGSVFLARTGPATASPLAEPLTKLIVNVDGGARGNPGPAAIGAVVQNADGEMLEERGERIGVATNNVAEYRALLLGIELAAAQGASEVELVGDSELIVRQVKGEYKVKDATMRRLHAEVKGALRPFEKWTIRHVRREHNAEADRLVNAALDGADA